MTGKNPVHAFSDVLQFVAIVLAPTIAAATVGFLTTLFLGGEVPVASMVATAAAAIGMILGVFLAIRVQSTVGATAFVARASATPELDVTFNLEAIASGKPDRIREALVFLARLGPAAHRALPEVERLCSDADPEIAGLAAAARAAIDGPQHVDR